MINSYKKIIVAEDLLEKEKIEQQLNDFYKELANNKLKKFFNSKKNFQFEQSLKDKLSKLSETIREKEVFCDSFEVLKDEQFLNYLKSSEKIVFDSDDWNLVSSYLKMCNNEKKFDSIDDFVLVHKTSYSPQNDTIYTPNSTGAKRREVIQLYGNDYELNYKCANNSVHFAVNGPVGDHLYGSWSNRDLAIITPMINCKNNKMLSFRPEDTFSEGNFKLGDNSFCLCPIDKREEILKKNNSLKVLCYDKDKISLDEAIKILLCYLGYKVETVSTHSWSNETDSNQFIKISDKLKIDLGSSNVTHVNSHQFLEVFLNENIYRLVEILKCIRDNRLDIQFDVEELARITKKGRKLGDVDIFADTNASIDDIKNYVYKLISAFAEEGFYLPEDNCMKILDKYFFNRECTSGELEAIFSQVNFEIFNDFLFAIGNKMRYYDEVLNDNKRKK